MKYASTADDISSWVFFPPFEPSERAEATCINTTEARTVGVFAYPLGRRDPQTVLVRLKATDVADLRDEVEIFSILGLLALAPLVFPVKVVEAAGQNKVSAGVR